VNVRILGIFLLGVLSSLLGTGLHAQSATSDNAAPPMKVAAGQFPCENDKEVTLSADFRYPGRYILEFERKLYTMERVGTSSGIVRLENVSKGVAWIQLPFKSMLMDQKIGKRLVDECMSPGQTRLVRAGVVEGAPETMVSGKKLVTSADIQEDGASRGAGVATK
jgi:hypothetical protein